MGKLFSWQADFKLEENFPGQSEFVNQTSALNCVLLSAKPGYMYSREGTGWSYFPHKFLKIFLVINVMKTCIFVYSL